MKLAEGKRRGLRMAAAALATVSVLMLLLASLFPWAALEARTKIGPIPVTLDADLFEHRVKYEANLSTSGSILGGMGGSRRIEGDKVFLTGLGDFQETIGFVKGTVKERTIKVFAYTWPPPQNGSADYELSVRAGTIPWWPVGLSQEVGLTVEMVSARNVSELRVVKVWFELRRPNPKDPSSPFIKKVWEASPGDTIKKVGEKRSYSASVKVDSDYGEFSLVGQAVVELQDEFGHSNEKPDGSHYETNPGVKEITLWTAGTDKTVRIGMLLLAFPLSLVSAVLVFLGGLLGILSDPRFCPVRWRSAFERAAWKVSLLGCVLALLAVCFFVAGAQALLELTGWGKWFKWTPMFSLAGGAAASSVLPAVLLFLVRPPAPPRAARAEKTPQGRPEGSGKEATKPGSDRAGAAPAPAPRPGKAPGDAGPPPRPDGKGGPTKAGDGGPHPPSP